jgi:hypothetical protein
VPPKRRLALNGLSGLITQKNTVLLAQFTRSFSRGTYFDLSISGMNCLRPLEHWDRGLNPTRGMDVCVRLFCVCVVLCVGSGLTTG